jgi:Concanavalin A-like lectin/glucanases superfamily/Secretion system C-terminal sorting domain
MKKIVQLFLYCLACSTSFTQAPTSGMVAYWPLSGNFTDAGPGAIATTVTGPIAATTNNLGTANSAMAFVNANPAAPTQYVSFPSTAAINFAPSADFSLCLSFKLNSLTQAGGMGLFDHNLNHGGYGFYYYTAISKLVFNCRGANIQLTTSFVANKWYHVTAVRSGSTLTAYVNGTLAGTIADGSGTQPYTYTGRIGASFFNGGSPQQYNALNGALDEIRIYNRALSTAEIAVVASFALPIKLTSFNANLKQNKVTLKWQTAQEQNSKNFTIQRSKDGVNFTNITTIAAVGNANIPTDYNYTDDVSTIQDKKLYYRLQQNDKDGTYTYSDILTIKTDKQNQDIIILTNPVKSEIKVQAYFAQKGNANVTIINNEGKIVTQKSIAVQEGINVSKILINELAKGVYILKINTDNENYTEKILKQ